MQPRFMHFAWVIPGSGKQSILEFGSIVFWPSNRITYSNIQINKVDFMINVIVKLKLKNKPLT